MKFHFHDWKRTEKPKHSHYDYNGVEVLTAKCRCAICGKEKVRKFMGKWYF